MKSGSLDMNDSISPSMTVGGGGLTLIPIDTVQVIGIIIGIAGIVLGVFRYIEARRANDINEKKLQFDIEKEKNSAEARNAQAERPKQDEEKKVIDNQ